MSSSTVFENLTVTGTLTLNGAGNLLLSKDVATCTSNACTKTVHSLQVTTESLTTATTASQAIVITHTGVTTTNHAYVTLAGGTNTRHAMELSAVCTTDTITVTITNNHASSLNGTVILNVMVM